MYTKQNTIIVDKEYAIGAEMKFATNVVSNQFTNVIGFPLLFFCFCCAIFNFYFYRNSQRNIL